MAQETEAELRAKIDEMRATNIAVMKELNDFKARFEGIDPEAVKALATEKARLEEEQRIKDGKFPEVLAAREKLVRGELEKLHAPVLVELDTTKSRLATLLIDHAVVAEATKLGLRPTAIQDVTARARAAFKLVDGSPRVVAEDGQSPRMGKDGVTPMTLAEWVGALGSDAPHLFAANAGSGAVGSGSGGTGLGTGSGNPYAKATWNLTEQSILEKRDPQLATRLAAAAK